MPARAYLPIAVLMALALGAPPSYGDEAPPRPAPGTHLDIEADRTEHDFGVVSQNADLETTFTITNTSDTAVELKRPIADCGCNAASLSTHALEPGASATLTVGFRTGTLSGRLSKRVRVPTTDHTRGELAVRLKIAVISGLILDPGTVSYKDVAFGTTPTTHFDVKWHEGLGKPFEVTEVLVPGHQFAIDVKTLEPENDEDPWRGYRVGLTFKTKPPLGIYSAEVLVRTTHPDHSRLTLPLSANVVGKIWMQARTLHFGVVPQGTARSARIKFRPRDENVVFEDVTARSRSGALEVEVGPDPGLTDGRYWVLTVTVPADAESGRLDDEIIELLTGVPGEEQIDVQVRGRVRGSRR